MSIDKVKAYFRQYGMENQILEFEHSSATVELAAEAVGCEPARIAKTMSFLKDGEPILIIAAGDVKVDNRKFKDQFHTKAKMIPYEEVEGYIGHAPGGVCPFAVKAHVLVYMDESLKRFETVYPAAGSSNSAIELNLEQLEKFSGSQGWVNVCKGWQA